MRVKTKPMVEITLTARKKLGKVEKIKKQNTDCWGGVAKATRQEEAEHHG
jgi:hypothetical protein